MKGTGINLGVVIAKTSYCIIYHSSSTPRLDSYWGGKNDLTAAMGFEKDGVTTILFRKKLKGLALL